MVIEYEQQKEKTRIEDIAQILFDGGILHFYDKRGSYQGGVNPDKCENFTAVDLSFCEKSAADVQEVKHGKWIKKELYEVAITAIEKQIPKKPLRGYTCKANNDSWRSCPVCHARQWNTHKYCSQCGQALDWSE